MAKRRLTIKILSLLFHSLAIAIIVFGSIINFHQYKIWGKPLIPQFVGIKRDADKSAKLIPSIKQLDRSAPPINFAGDSPCILAGSLKVGTTNTIIASLVVPPDRDPALPFLRASGLRGPPLV